MQIKRMKKAGVLMLAAVLALCMGGLGEQGYLLLRGMLSGQESAQQNVAHASSGSDDTVEYTLTMRVKGDDVLYPPGSTDPPAITNPTVGVHTYTENDDVPCSFVLEDGWQFEHWELDGVEVDPPPAPDPTVLTVDMNTDHIVTAVFVRTHYTLTMEVEGDGTLYPAGSPSPPATTDPIVGDHTRVWMTTVPCSYQAADGWVFDHWTVTEEGETPLTFTTETIDVLMDADKTVRAVFEREEYTFTMEIEGEGVLYPAGTADPPATTTPAVSPPSLTREFEDEVPCSYLAFDGWVFSHWIVTPEGGTAETYTTETINVVMVANTVVRAVFERQMCSLTVVITGQDTQGTVNVHPDDSSGDVTCSAPSTTLGPYVWGTGFDLTAQPVAGWDLSKWRVNGTQQLPGEPPLSSPGDPLTISFDLTSDTTVEVDILEAFTLTVATSPADTGDVVPTRGVHTFHGESVTLIASNPPPGWIISHWDVTRNGTTETFSGSEYEIEAVDTDTEATAVFLEEFTLTVVIDGQGNVDVTREGTTVACSPPGNVIEHCLAADYTLAATPAQGWAFDRWECYDNDIDDSQNATDILSLDGNTTVTAVFVQVYSLTVNIEGQGTVLVNPGNLTCELPTTAIDPLNAGTYALAPTAAAGWAFDHWESTTDASIDQSVTADESVILDGHESVTAIFSPAQRVRVTLLVDGETSPDLTASVNFSPEARNAEPSALIAYYLPGTQVTVTALAGSLQGQSVAFHYWLENGQIISTDAALSIDIEEGQDRELEVSYTEGRLVTIGVGVDDGAGTVLDPTGLNPGWVEVEPIPYPGAVFDTAADDWWYPYHVELELTAVQNEGFVFSYWLGADSDPATGTELVRLSEWDETPVLIIESGVWGETRQAVFVEGDVLAVTTAFDDGSGTPVVDESVGSIRFSPDPPGDSGSGATRSETYLTGEVVTITAQAKAGYVFDRWEDALTGSTNPAQITVDSDKAVTAVFVAAHTLSVTTAFDDEAGSTTPNADAGACSFNPDPPGGSSSGATRVESYTHGDTVTLTATAKLGYVFDRWEGALTGTANPGQVTIDSDKAVTAVFIDAGLVLVGLAETDLVEVLEGTSTTLTLEASTSDHNGFTVDLATAPAVPFGADASDYSVQSSVTFAANETSKTIAVTAVQDDEDEFDERFYISISQVSAGDAVVDTNADQAGFRITDDDQVPEIAFVQSSSTIGEGGGQVTINVALSEPSGKPVSVRLLAASGGYAGSTSDYTFSPLIATIPAGETTVGFTVTAIEDDLDEPNETQVFSLPTAMYNATPGGGPLSHTLTILDNDDTPVVEFASATSFAAESAGTAGVTVVLANPSSQAVTANYSVSGTATNGAGGDFTLASGSLTIPAGQTSGTITVTLHDDAVTESSETVELTLTSATNATVGAVAMHTLTIADDEGSHAVWIDGITSLAENDIVIALTVSLSHATDQTVTVPFDVSASTATEGVDFWVSQSPLTIAPGETSVPLYVTLQDDQTPETDETVVVTLQTPTNAVLLNGSQVHTLAIIDTDGTDPVTYPLTISVVGEGTVACDPSASEYDENTPVTLTPTPASGWVFDRWEEDVTGSDVPATVTMDSAKSVTAVFRQEFTLTVTTIGTGTVETDPATLTFFAGTEVTVTAIAGTEVDPAWAFVHWQGDDIDQSTSPVETLIMDADKSVTAVFSDGERVQVTVLVDGTPVAVPLTYTIDFEPEGLFADDTPHTNYYLPGTPVTVTALHCSLGNEAFHYWMENGQIISTNPELSFVIEEGQDRDLCASYTAARLITLGVGVDDGTGTALDPEGLNPGWIEVDPAPYTGAVFDTASSGWWYPYHVELGLTAFHNEGFYLAYWLDNDTNSFNGTEPFRLPEYDGVTARTVEPGVWWETRRAIFMEGEVLTAVTAFDNGSGSAVPSESAGAVRFDPDPPGDPASGASRSETYCSGELVTLTAEGGPGRVFDRWEGALTSSDNPASVTVDTDKSVTAVFVAGHALTVTTALDEGATVVACAEAGDVSFSPDPPGDSGSGATRIESYTDATPVTLTAVAASGYVFDHWEIGGTVQAAQTPPTELTVTMTADTEVTAVFVDAGLLLVGQASPGPIEILEGTSATLTLTASKDTHSGFTVDLSVTAGTPHGADVADYTVPASVTFDANETSKTVTVTVVQDAVDEYDEGFDVVISQVSAGTAVVDTNADSTRCVIIDEDPWPDLAFVQSSSSVSEDGGPVSIDLALSTASGKDIAVRLDTGWGVYAESTDDYTFTPTEVTIPAGSTTASFTVTPVDDSLDEPDECTVFSVAAGTLVNPTAPVSHSLTIVDNDATPTVEYDAGNLDTLPEDMGVVNLKVNLSAASGQDVTVPFTVTGAATEGEDYSVSPTGPAELIIPAGSTTAWIIVQAISDLLDEADEEITVTLGTPTNATLAGGQQIHTLHIADDDDPPMVLFSTDPSKNPTSASEDSGLTMIEVGLVSDSGLEVTVPYSVSGTATVGEENDYKVAPGWGPNPVLEVTFPPGSHGRQIEVRVTDDVVAEADETIIITLGNPTNGTLLGGAQEHTLTILDNDTNRTVEFDAENAASVPEDGGTLDITVNLSATSGQDVTVPFTVSGSAAADVDYALNPAAPGQLTIPGGQTAATLTVTVTDDAADEDDETVEIALGAPTGASLAGGSQAHTLEIRDNDDGFTVEYDAGNLTSALEDSGTVNLTVNLSAASSQDVVVPFTVSGLAVEGTDYTISPAAPMELTIPVGSTSGTIAVALTSDTLDEENEDVVVTLGTPTGAVLSGGAQAHSLTITDDDDPPAVRFSVDPSKNPTNASEDGGRILLEVNLLADSGKDVTVPFSLSGSATEGTAYDYTTSWLGQTREVVLEAGEQAVQIPIQLMDDTTDEDDESVVVTLGPPTNATLVGGAQEHALTIVDNDDPSVLEFDPGNAVTAEEGSGVVNLFVTLTPVSGVDVSVSFSVGGTAVENDDYTLSPADPKTVTIPAGQTMANIMATLINDGISENSEELTVSLGTPTNATLAGGTQSHTLTIVDEGEGATVEFDDAVNPLTVDESAGTVNLTVKLSEVVAADVTVPFNMTGSTAIEGADYGISASPLTIAAGALSGTIQITLTDDALDEAAEDIIVRLDAPINATLLNGVQTHTLQVTDNDSEPSVEFTAGSSTIDENAGEAAIAVALSGQSGKTITVDYAVTGGTATGGNVDYVLDAGQLTFAPGTTAQDITVGVVDDLIDEPEETVEVTLSLPSNAALGTPAVHTLTIIDNDDPPTVQFSGATSSVAEEIASAGLPVTLSAESAFTVTVDYAVTGGSATGGDADYALASGQLTFAPEVTSQDISASIVDDLADESDETVEVTLSLPSNAALGTPAVHTLTITDNDTLPTAAFSVTPASGAAPLTVTFADESVDGTSAITAWEWDFNDDGTPDSNAQNPSHEYTEPGTYTVELTVTSAAGSHTTAQTDCVTVAPGLVAYWPFDDAAGASLADDAGPHALDLTLGPQAALGVAGIANSAMCVTPGTPPAAAADRAESGTTVLDLSSHATVMGWFKLNTATTDQTVLSKGAPQSANTGYEVVVNPTGNAGKGVMLAYGDGAAAVSAYSNQTEFAVGEWYHLAVVFDAGDVTFYLNGQTNGTSLGNAASFAANDINLRIGADSADGAHLDGTVDELILHQAALDATDIGNEFGNVAHTLTDASVQAEGHITLNPAGGAYTHTTVVQLQGTPHTGYTFKEWGGADLADLTTNGDQATITMNGDKTVAAVFEQNPTAAFTYTADGLEVTFSSDGSSYGDGFTELDYLWEFGDGQPDSTEDSPVHDFQEAGTYTVRLTVTNSGGVASDWIEHTVTVGAGPKAAIHVEYLTSAAPYEVRVTDVSVPEADTTIHSREWTFEDNTKSVLFGPHTRSFSNPGTYNITLEVTQGAAGGPTDSVTVPIEINAGPTAGFSVSLDHRYVGHDVTFTDASTPNGAENTQWQWGFGDGTTATGEGPHVHVFGAAGDYNVSLTVRNEHGFDEEIVTVHIDDPPLISLAPDLAVASTTGVSPGDLFKPGASISVASTVNNGGAVDAPARTDALCLSLDEVPDDNDLELATESAVLLTPGADQTVTFATTTLEDVAPGDYFLIVRLDKNNDVPEAAENNNTTTIAITVVDSEMTDE